MFRQSLRRCAGRTGGAAMAASVSRSARLPMIVFQQNAIRRGAVAVEPIRTFAATSRMFNSDAAAENVETQTESSPNGPVQTFHDLAQLGVHPTLIRTLTEDFQYDTMTPVQAQTINPALKGTDIVAQARTGTGKTLAFLLPLLQRMLSDDLSLADRRSIRHARSDDIRGIVISPTRELAMQIANEAKRLVAGTGLVVQTAVGGTQKSFMLRKTKSEGCHLLVATPGRLKDLLQDEYSGIDAPNLSALVLDEADRMLDVGFEQELKDITKLLPDVREKARQTMLVSATIPDEVIRLARSYVRPEDFEFVQTIPENENLTHDHIPQHVVAVSGWQAIFPSLFQLLDREFAAAQEEGNHFKAIVYFNTTAMTQLAAGMGMQRRKNGSRYAAIGISSRATQEQRSRAANAFRKFDDAVLYSSDVTARGMDFPNVTHVIQVDAPRERDTYIHRLGRTGRQNKAGQGWLLLPSTNVQGARRLLEGLPLKPNTGLEEANAVPDLENKSELREELAQIYSTLERDTLSSAYTSILGSVPANNKRQCIEDLNAWTEEWGWSEPPRISHKLAHQLGLRGTAVNIADGFGYKQDRRGGGDFGGDHRDELSSDPFSLMSSQVRRDGDRRSGGFSRGRKRGFSRRDFGDDSW